MYKYLANTGVKLSCFGLGTMTFGGEGRWSNKGNINSSCAKRMIDICLDYGINFIDTADIYSNGMSEKMIGDIIAEKRKKVFLATKVRGKSGDGINDIGLSKLHIIQGCEDSLRRLKTDYIDLYQVHVFDPCTPIEETIAGLDYLVKQGKVRYIGCSNFAAWQIMKALGKSEALNKERFVSLQAHYSLLNRDIEEEIVPLLKDQGMGLIVWSPLEGGFLSGKYEKGKERPQGVRLSNPEKEMLKVDEKKAYIILEVMKEIAEKRCVALTQVALNYPRQKEYVTSVLLGARTEEQLIENIGALDWTLSTEEIKKLDTVSQPVVRYPMWLQKITCKDRL